MRLSRLGQQIAGGLRAVQLRAADLMLHRQPHPLPPVASMLAVDGPAVVTSTRWLAGGLELRLFNPTPEHRGGKSAFHRRHAIDVSGGGGFREPPVGTAHSVIDGAVEIVLGAKQIKTLRFA